MTFGTFIGDTIDYWGEREMLVNILFGIFCVIGTQYITCATIFAGLFSFGTGWFDDIAIY